MSDENGTSDVPSTSSTAEDEPTAQPEIELIIKASTIDGRRKGACLFCHEYFMDLYLLAELKTISLKITTVDMLKPPPDFRSVPRRDSLHTLHASTGDVGRGPVESQHSNSVCRCISGQTLRRLLRPF
jgi:hypothetical protein